FNKGALKAYYNGIPVSSTYGNPVTGSGELASLSQHGVSIGSRITRVNGNPSNKFENSEFDMCFNGVLDQVGLFSRALNDDEIWDFYTGTMVPAKVDYIRD
nr:hypothetical protein [Candidatus Syntrophosphaera sp.]